MYWFNPRRRVSSPQRSGAQIAFNGTASLLHGSASWPKHIPRKQAFGVTLAHCGYGPTASHLRFSLAVVGPNHAKPQMPRAVMSNKALYNKPNSIFAVKEE